MATLGSSDIPQMTRTWEFKILELQHLDHHTFRFLELWNLNLGSMETFGFRDAGRLDLETFDPVWY